MYTTIKIAVFAVMSIAYVVDEGCGNGARECEHRATVIDLTGLDGCGLLLQLENGKKILPQFEEDNRIELVPGEIVNISYVELKDQMSICMAEDFIARITCFERVKAGAGCQAFKDPFEQAWSTRVMQAGEIVRIEKHPKGKSFTYHFISADHSRAVYSCEGEFLCSVPRDNPAGCDHLAAEEDMMEIIYVVDE